jgi:hypothetical protein
VRLLVGRAGLDQLDEDAVGVAHRRHGHRAVRRRLVDAAGRAAEAEVPEARQGDVDGDEEGEEEEPGGGRADRGARVGAAVERDELDDAASGEAGSPRNSERSVPDRASNSVGQSPSKVWSMRTSRPRPSR